MALVRDDINYKIRDDLMNTEVQTIWIELIRKNSKNILVGGVYREWSDNQDKDADEILDQFQRATRENIPVIILGDMNLDSKLWSKRDYVLLQRNRREMEKCTVKSWLKMGEHGLHI